MNFRRLIKFSLIGFALQIVMLLAAPFAGQGYRDAIRGLHEPWMMRGDALIPSGPAGHAGIGGGVLLGLAFGLIVFSLLIGAVIYLAYGLFASRSKSANR